MKRAAALLAPLLAAAVWAGLSAGRRTDPGGSMEYGVVPDFSLTDAAGKTVRRSDIPGPWLAAFMFTNCGTECPMMTAKMKRLSGELPGVRMVSFSLDPADTPEKLKRYAKSYGAEWLFLTGAPGEVKRLSREGFKLAAADGDGGQILHSKNLVLVGSDGRIRGYFDSDDASEMRRLIRLAKSLRPAS